MKLKTKRYLLAVLLLSGSLLSGTGEAAAQEPKPQQPAKAHLLSKADEKAIRQILKDQETAWNQHDMNAFTKDFRDDAEGIDVAGMYWQGKAALLKHLTDFHATFLKNVQEYLTEIHVHSLGEGYAVAVNISKVDGFKAPDGVEFPASRHPGAVLLAKESDGWKIVHFHNPTIDEAKLQGVHAALQK